MLTTIKNKDIHNILIQSDVSLNLMKFPPSISPEYPLWHFVDDHPAAPGQQVPLSSHLTAQGVVLHLPHPVHLPTSAWFSSRRRGHHIHCIISCEWEGICRLWQQVNLNLKALFKAQWWTNIPSASSACCSTFWRSSCSFCNCLMRLSSMLSPFSAVCWPSTCSTNSPSP